MTATEKQNELYNKILKGLDKVYEKLVEYKKQKESEIVVLKDGKIKRIKPE